MKNKKEIDKTSLNELIHLANILLRVFYVITIVGIILVVLLAFEHLQVFKLLFDILGVIAPLFIGFVVAWLFYPLHKKMLDSGLNKILSALIIFLAILGVILLFIYIFIPVLYNQVNELISYLPSLIGSISEAFSNGIKDINIPGLDITSIKDGVLSALENLVVSITQAIPNGIVALIKNIVSVFGTILISLVVSIYMLIDFDNLSILFYKIFPKKSRGEYVELLQSMGANTRKVVNGTLLVAFMVFVFDTIGFALVGLKASVLFALFCGITDLIPYIGPYIGGAVAVIVGFTQSPIVGLGVLIIALIVQLLESYILQPVVMSKAMHLHPVMIIVGLLLFGHFFGIIGMIVATPCMAIIKEIVLFVSSKLKKNKIRS